MQDSLGVYYLPRPGIPAVRVYVRRGDSGEIEFRMWDQDHPEVWENTSGCLFPSSGKPLPYSVRRMPDQTKIPW